MTYGQNVPQMIVRNISSKDNPGTLPKNLYAQAHPTSQPLDFSKIKENGTKQKHTTPKRTNFFIPPETLFFLPLIGANSGRMTIY